ncbi:MAG: hypothetical protein JWO37_3740 [Acidimicrobiales bacterium]|nr:hypothetical protein [Acidimicrobiales bacterium]
MIAVFTIPLTHFQVPLEIVVLGLVTGLTYALLGAGLTLVYRATRVINFAHGELGALPALLVPILVLNHGLSYWVAVPLALATGAVGGGLIEVLVIRRLAAAPRLLVMVATIGVAEVLLVAELVLPRKGRFASSPYPVPFHARVTAGNLHLGAGELLILAIAPVLVLGLSAFLRRTNVGMATRAASENREAAELAGIPVSRVSLVVWTLAGLFAAASAILAGPTKPSLSTEALGPSIMVRALAAAMLGGLTSLPQVLLGGLAIGLVELLVLWNYPTGGAFELVLFVIVVVSLLMRRGLGQLARGTEESSWSLAGSLRALAPDITRMPRVVVGRRAGLVALAGAAIFVPLALDNSQRVLLSSVVVFAVMGLSLVVLTGWAGQVSLGQFAFVGVGAAVGGRLAQLGYPPWAGVFYAAVAGGLAALVIGVPALRIRGLFLAVTTLAFAVACSNWLFRQDWLVHVNGADTSMQLPRPHWLGIDFGSELNYCWLCLFVLLIVVGVVHRFRVSGVGRAVMAVRDNEAAAATLSISPRRAKLTAFVLAGAIAAVAGYFYGGLLVSFGDPKTFAPSESLALVAMVIFGGVTTITGAILGAFWVRGIPYFFGGNWGLLSTGAGLLVVLLVFPGGLASLAFRLRDRLVALLTRQPIDRLRSSDRAEGAPRPRLRARATGNGNLSEPPVTLAGLALEARDVVVQYGGNRAVDGVCVHANVGEVVALVGPNGAGKTTLFDVLSGQLRPDGGMVLLDGRDITHLRPHERALLGLGRTFQQARLFGDLTLVDALKVALEREDPAEVVPSLLGLPPARASERHKDLRAHELVDLLGLGPWAGRPVSELSTGTRRVAELGCMVALGARVLLLDEPMAGIAQREVEAFAPVLGEIRDHLGATLLLIDHDIPMVTTIADRIYVLATGRVIAEGEPAVVREDPVVVAAYLGTDERAIRRSGHVAGATGRGEPR